MTVIFEPLSDEPFESRESSYADIIERLFQRFEAVVPLQQIVTVVRDAREQLRGSPLGALPELTERLAIERLGAFDRPALTAPVVMIEGTVKGQGLAH